jgi:uncharacterized protein
MNSKEIKKHILFIQGAGEGAYEEDEKLAASLRHLLGSSYEVHYPEMKNEDDADYETWANQIKEEVGTLDGAIIVVGHSVGASVLIKFLSEQKINKTVLGIFLIAAPFWGGDNGWTYDGYETLVVPKEGVSKLLTDVPIFLYHSRDDETVPFTHLSLYADMFPMATKYELDRRGHQLNNDLSEVAHDIKNLL